MVIEMRNNKLEVWKHVLYPLELHSYLVKVKAKYNLESIHKAMTFIIEDRRRLKRENAELKGKAIQNSAINRELEINVS